MKEPRPGFWRDFTMYTLIWVSLSVGVKQVLPMMLYCWHAGWTCFES